MRSGNDIMLKTCICVGHIEVTNKKRRLKKSTCSSIGKSESFPLCRGIARGWLRGSKLVNVYVGSELA